MKIIEIIKNQIFEQKRITNLIFLKTTYFLKQKNAMLLSKKNEDFQIVRSYSWNHVLVSKIIKNYKILYFCLKIKNRQLYDLEMRFWKNKKQLRKIKIYHVHSNFYGKSNADISWIHFPKTISHHWCLTN